MIYLPSSTITNDYLITTKQSITLYIKREDQLHPHVSGNKYRKLKYNIIKAKAKGFNTLLSFGGAYSNHIAALATIGKLKGFSTIGIIRGKELEHQMAYNPTLKTAINNGMKLKFITRNDYKNKQSEPFINALKREFGHFYLLPEGGTNTLAVKGCKEILTEQDIEFDYICCPVGTGGTVSGIINSTQQTQHVLGFLSVKSPQIKKDILNFVNTNNWQLISDYHFGGYAKINQELITFINQFKTKYNISLDPIYTGKMMFGVFDMIKKGYFSKGSKILTIHTGGLQGNLGMNIALSKRGWTQLI